MVQNNFETVTKHYVVDYLSVANRDIMVTEDGSFTLRYVYDESGKRLSAEFGYADGTARGTQNANGEHGENPASDIAVNNIGKVWYHTSLLNSTLFAVDKDGEVIAHMIYDPWGNPLVETYTDTNYSGLDNLNNFTGYTWDETLGLYFAQNRFYDVTNHRFTQEDIIKDGANWYVYCGNVPTTWIDPWGHNPTDDLIALDLSKIGSLNRGGKTYYSARDIFTALGNEPNYDSKTKIATFSLSTSTNGRHVKEFKLSVQQKRSLKSWLGGVVTFSGNVTGYNKLSGTMTVFHKSGTNYISYNELLGYFKKIWCETTKVSDQNTQVVPSVPNNLVTKVQLQTFGWSDTSDTFVNKLNAALEKYKITDRGSIALFMATMAAESGWGKYTIEQGSDAYFAGKAYSKNERGAGYIQITWRSNHLQFLKSMNDSFSGSDTATYIAQNYPIESSAWYWAQAANTGAGNLNAYVAQNGSNERIFLITQYFVNGYVDDSNFDSDLVSIKKVQNIAHLTGDYRLMVEVIDFQLAGVTGLMHTTKLLKRFSEMRF